MKQLLRRLYHDTDIGDRLLGPAKAAYVFSRYRLLPERASLKRMFKKSLGYDLDLDNPRTLNEKIQWLKLYDRNPLLPQCADKLAVREYIREKVGEQYLIPLVSHTRDPVEIVPENLPSYPVILKTTHSSGSAIIVMDKSKQDWKGVRRELSRSLRINHYYRTREWQYKEIEPQIVVEKLLIGANGAPPFDYKFHCFRGRLIFIQVDIDRHTRHRRNLYSSDWVLMDCRWKCKNGKPVPKPRMLDKMKALAETIAADFIYTRVDLYALGSKVYFGELTFHPESGFECFSPSYWDRKLGEKLELSSFQDSAPA